MSTRVSAIMARIAELERELGQEFEEEIAKKRREFKYRIEQTKIAFESEVCALHKRLRHGMLAFLWEAPIVSLLVAPDAFR